MIERRFRRPKGGSGGFRRILRHLKAFQRYSGAFQEVSEVCLSVSKSFTVFRDGSEAFNNILRLFKTLQKVKGAFK